MQSARFDLSLATEDEIWAIWRGELQVEMTPEEEAILDNYCGQKLYEEELRQYPRVTLTRTYYRMGEGEDSYIIERVSADRHPAPEPPTRSAEDYERTMAALDEFWDSLDFPESMMADYQEGKTDELPAAFVYVVEPYHELMPLPNGYTKKTFANWEVGQRGNPSSEHHPPASWREKLSQTA